MRTRSAAIALILLTATAGAVWLGWRMLNDMENPDYPRPVSEMKTSLMNLAVYQNVFHGRTGRFAASVADLTDTVAVPEGVTLVIERGDSVSWRAVARHKDLREACFIDGLVGGSEQRRPDCEGRYRGSPY